MQDHFGGVSQKHQNEKQRTIKMKAKTSQQNISEFFFSFSFDGFGFVFICALIQYAYYTVLTIGRVCVCVDVRTCYIDRNKIT